MSKKSTKSLLDLTKTTTTTKKRKQQDDNASTTNNNNNYDNLLIVDDIEDSDNDNTLYVDDNDSNNNNNAKKKAKRAPAKPRAKKDPDAPRKVPAALNLSNSKSKVRHLLEATFPMAFTKSTIVGNKITASMLSDLEDSVTRTNNGKTAPGDSKYELYIEDALQPLKSYNVREDDTYKLKTEQLAGNMLRNCNYYMQKSLDDPTTHFILFDKYRHVPITKGGEQQKRDANPSNNVVVKNSKDIDEYDNAPPYFMYGQPIPLDWNDAKEDREGRFSQAIRFITKCWLTPTMNYTCLNPPPGKKVILDGHCLSRKDMDELGVTGIEEAEEQLVKRLMDSNKKITRREDIRIDFRDIPICIETPKEGEKAANLFPWQRKLNLNGNNNNNSNNSIDANIDEIRMPNQRLIYVVPELYNELGEADYTIFFMIRKMFQFSQRNLKTKIFSIDGDITNLAIAHIHRWFSDIDFNLDYNQTKQIEKRKQIESTIAAKNKSNNNNGNVSIAIDTPLKKITIQEEFAYLPQLTIQYEPRPTWMIFGQTLNEELVREINVKQLYIDMERTNFYRMSIGEKKKIQKEQKQQQQQQQQHNDDDNDGNGNDNTISKVSTLTVDENDKMKRNALFKHKAINFTLIWIIGGCDYNESIKGITHEHLLEAIKRYSNYIGDVIVFTDDSMKYDCGISIDGGAYFRLLKCAYCIAKQKSIEGIHPSQLTLDRIDELTKTPKSVNPLMQTELLSFTLLHAIYIVKMMYQVGNNKLMFNGYPSDYGYAMIDTTKAWTRDNTKRIYSEKDK